MSSVAFFTMIKEQSQKEIKIIIDSRDLSALMKIASRSKTTGKSQLVKCLAKYNLVDQDYVYTVLLTGKGNKSERKVPVQFITDRQWK